MGQGYSLTTLPAGPSAIETPELADLTFEKGLGGARFLRTVRARHKNGIVVAKVCMKSSTNVSFKKYAKALKEERRALAHVPNALAYQRVLETGNYGILVRQFIHSSLYDRISIRPFLEPVEKKWIAFQLICAVRDCHARGVYHGDIKSENVLITSWGWVYLTDFSSTFKPTYLPEDNPADFSFYYDTSARRTCYLAPERFLAAGQTPNESDVVQWNMDIFSLGCVIAELFTESPTFTLSQLFKYRKLEYDPSLPLLNKIDDEQIRALVVSMIRLNPEDRWHAQDYLDEYKGKAFPLYFYQHLHTLMEDITDPTSGRKPVVARDTNNGLADDRIDRIYNDFEMLSVSLGYEDVSKQSNHSSASMHGLFPLQVDLPNARHAASPLLTSEGDNGTFILLNVVTSSVRSTARAASKIRACELLLAFAERLPDEAKLDRVLPYVMPLLEDSNEMVLLAALRTMTQLLALVTVASPINSFLFAQYIFPRLQIFVNTTWFKNYALVRATYAACLATLADTASRFLDMIQALRADGSLPSIDPGVDDENAKLASFDTYDATRTELLEQFEAQTKVFLTDNNNAVRRAFLTSVTSLCVFFGESKASEVILSHLNTYLNDPDWLLKCAFFKTIVGVSVYVGGARMEDFILPLMVQALTDPQDFVVEQALRSLASMAELGLLQRPKTWELIDAVARFTMHPNLWIREAAAHFVSAATTYLSVADVRILVTPLISPYLKTAVAGLNEAELLDALKKPLPRAVLDLALAWANRADRGVFWKPAKESRQLSYQATAQTPIRASVADLTPKSLARVPKNDEDEQFLGRLRSAGMREEDEFKLLAFREYLWRAAHRKSNDDDPSGATMIYDEVVKLARLKVRPHTVLFDNDPDSYGRHVNGSSERLITDALQEATVVDQHGERDVPYGDHATHIGDGKNDDQGFKITALKKQPSGSLSSSPSSGIGLLAKDVGRALRQREARPGVLSGPDFRNKAPPEVATDDTTAAGKLLHTSASGSRRPSPSKRQSKSTTGSRGIHSYDGNDPNVLKMLDNVYVETFPIDAAEFGPLIQQSKRGPIPSGGGQQTRAALWRPQGRLVAVLSEHTDRVCRLVVSPDHMFFLSASDDGSVKVWDAERLERNVSHRSRSTYRMSAGAKVTSVCFIESTHTFVCTGSDGSVHIIKVDVSEASKESGHATRYGKPKTVREWQIPKKGSAEEYAVWSEHMRRDGTSTLVLATNLNRIVALDLRHMNVLFEFNNPAQHGAITSFCIGRKHDWLLVGTSHGILDLWDLRFQIKLRSWAFPSASPIARVQLHPSRKTARRNRVCISGGIGKGEVTVWDIEKVICNEVYRPVTAGAGDRNHARDFELRNLEDERHGSLLGRVAESVDKDKNTSDASIAAPAASTCVFFGQQPAVNDAEVQVPFAITGGPDNKVRFWDPERLEGCRLVSGGSPDEKPTYAFSLLGLDTKIISETPSEDAQPVASAVESNKIGPTASAKRGHGGVPPKPSRYDAIRLSAQHLLSGHLDKITDVSMLERPFGMVLSADRSGQIFVHQ